MITKEDARLLYNLYSQIETTESIISDLTEFVKSESEKTPDVITPNYRQFGSIEISIPHFQDGKFKVGSARVFNISYHAALRVLNDHVEHLKEQVAQMNDKLLNGDN